METLGERLVGKEIKQIAPGPESTCVEFTDGAGLTINVPVTIEFEPRWGVGPVVASCEFTSECYRIRAGSCTISFSDCDERDFPELFVFLDSDGTYVVGG